MRAGAGPNEERYGKVEAFRLLGNRSQPSATRCPQVSAHYPRLQIPTLRISLIPACKIGVGNAW